MSAMKSVLACIPIIIVGYILLPARGQTPGSAALSGPAASADDDEPAGQQSGTGELCHCNERGSKLATMRIKEILDQPLHSNGVEFADVSLLKVLQELQDDYHIPIHIDTPALDEAGVGTDSPVTRKIRDVSFRAALNLLLDRLQLTWIIRDEVLVVTTKEKAGRYLVTCVYNVGDLVDKKDPDYDNLIDTIVSCVATDTWAENGGGEAEIRPFAPGLLVVSQTQAVHEDISALLSNIRGVRGGLPPAKLGARNYRPPPSQPQQSVSNEPKKDESASAKPSRSGGGFF
jgi:hypothetical protein